MSGLPDLLLPNLRAKGPRPVDARDQWPSTPNTPVADYSADEDEFIRAVAHFRTVNKVACPTLCQLLWVAKQLGFRRGHSVSSRTCR